MIRVKVPATSANLGPGYDCLGLALDEFATVTFDVIDQGLIITGCEEAYCNEQNLVYQAFCEALAYMEEQIPGIHIHMDTKIPYARGLGSSATCIIAGIAGANALCNHRMNKYEMFDLATRIEGHPDNIAPAIFGALCVSFMDEGKANMIRFGIRKELFFLAIIPDYEVSTKKAREVLPTSMSYSDAIYQMGRCCAFAKAFEIGNFMILRKACKDKMHEPYRKELIKEYEIVKQVSEDEGGITMFISGSGPTLITLCDSEETVQNIMFHLQQQYPTWDFRIMHATYDGVQDEVM